MKLTNKSTQHLIKVPLLALVVLLIISAITYTVIKTYGFNFDSNLVSTERAEIKGKPEEINKAVSEIYSKVEIINTEVGNDSEANQIQRLYFQKKDESVKTVRDIVGQNQNLTLTISNVKPGIKTDFSSELINLVAVVCVFLLIINFTLFRKAFDYQYIFLYTLLNLFTVLIALCVLLTGLSFMGKYGWHISPYTLNVFVGFVFALPAILAAISLLFRRSLGDVEYISNVGESFRTFIGSSLRAYIAIILILIILLAPFLYFYYFRVEALVIILVSIFISLLIRFAYAPVLNWYDQVRLAKKKFSKKKK